VDRCPRESDADRGRGGKRGREEREKDGGDEQRVGRRENNERERRV